MKQMSPREKAIFAGLYLSKFDSEGLRRLGFDSFLEAFNVIGSALGVQPASVKNYRDEFDPLFPNERKGWHKRPIREYCRAVKDALGGLNLEDATNLLKRIIYKEDDDLDVLADEIKMEETGGDESFAKRLITGKAAEQYFRSKHSETTLFKDLKLEDRTERGCGFDFKLSSPTSFYAVEVKGLSEVSGTVALTSKEYSVASALAGRFFLYVVKNFKESPFDELYQDPVNGKLAFGRREQKIIQVTWTAKV